MTSTPDQHSPDSNPEAGCRPRTRGPCLGSAPFFAARRGPGRGCARPPPERASSRRAPRQPPRRFRTAPLRLECPAQRSGPPLRPFVALRAGRPCHRLREGPLRFLPWGEPGRLHLPEGRNRHRALSASARSGDRGGEVNRGAAEARCPAGSRPPALRAAVQGRPTPDGPRPGLCTEAQPRRRPSGCPSSSGPSGIRGCGPGCGAMPPHPTGRGPSPGASPWRRRTPAPPGPGRGPGP